MLPLSGLLRRHVFLVVLFIVLHSFPNDLINPSLLECFLSNCVSQAVT